MTQLQRIDTEVIRDRVPILSYVQNDIKPRRLTEHKRGYWWGACPFCGEGNDRFKVDPSTEHFWCRRCEKKGDVIGYVMARNGWDFVTAAKSLAGVELPKIPATNSHNGANGELSGSLRVKWSEKLDKMVNAAISGFLAEGQTGPARAALTWLKKRGINADDIARDGLGYNDQWREIIPGYKLPPGIIIPRYTSHDVTVSAVNVYLAREARKLTGERRMYAKGSRPKSAPFNYFKLSPSSGDGPTYTTVIVCEGELDAVLLGQFLPPFALAIATGGADMMPDDIALLNDKRVILALDNDAAGRRATAQWLDRIPSATAAGIPEGNDITDFWKARGDVGQWINQYLEHDDIKTV